MPLLFVNYDRILKRILIFLFRAIFDIDVLNFVANMDADRFNLDNTFLQIKHYKMNWHFQNIYQCRKLLKTTVDGPDFGKKCSSPFPWRLKLGQSTHPLQNGIALFIIRDDEARDVWVNFRVNVRKQNNSDPLLDENYQHFFTGGKSWESPILITNRDFSLEPLWDKFCNFWEIHVQLMWNENVELETFTREHSLISAFQMLCFKELGDDLKRFCKSKRFSDVSIYCEGKEIPAHKVILEARNPYFAETINSYYSGTGEGIHGDSIVSTDLTVMNAFLNYLYTGDIDSLTEQGPPPVGIYKYAQTMRKYDLEWLTSPLQLFSYSFIKSESIQHELVVMNLCSTFSRGDPSRLICCDTFSAQNATFTLIVKQSMSYDQVPNISVYLQLDELVEMKGIYVIFDLMVKNGEKHVGSVRAVGDLIPNGCLSLQKYLPLHYLAEKPDTYFISDISFSNNSLSTDVEMMTIDCAMNPYNKTGVSSLAPILGKGCHGWINLSCDLAQLLMTTNHWDCCIVVGNFGIRAHRIILAARSPYFAAIFDAREKECVGSSKGMQIFVEEDVGLNVQMMNVILEEIYTGSCYIESLKAADRIHDAADFFGLEKLKMKCRMFAEEHGLDENFFRIT